MEKQKLLIRDIVGKYEVLVQFRYFLDWFSRKLNRKITHKLKGEVYSVSALLSETGSHLLKINPLATGLIKRFYLTDSTDFGQFGENLKTLEEITNVMQGRWPVM